MGNPLLIGSSGRTAQLFGSHAWKGNFALAMLTILVTMIAALAISLTWGLSTMLGIIFIAYAGINLLFSKGSFVGEATLLFVFLGVMFLVLSYLGVSFTVIDFSEFEFARTLHQIFN